MEEADQYLEEGAQEIVSYLQEDVKILLGVTVPNSRGLVPGKVSVKWVCFTY